MNAVESIVQYLDTNPSVVASCIAVFGSIAGAVSGTALTLHFTGENQRKHLVLETAMKKERELEEQRKLVLFELMTLWNEAFLHTGAYLNLVIRHRTEEMIPSENPVKPGFFSSEGSIVMLEKMTAINDSLRHQICKFILFYGESDLYKAIDKFHIKFAWYGLNIALYTEQKQAEERECIKEMRDDLVKLFREQLKTF